MSFLYFNCFGFLRLSFKSSVFASTTVYFSVQGLRFSIFEQAKRDEQQ